MMRFGQWCYVSHSVFKRTYNCNVCFVAKERKEEGGKEGGGMGRDRLRERERETERQTDGVTCSIQKVKCQGACGCDSRSSGPHGARPAAAFSFTSLVRDRSLGWCVSKVYFYISFIDSKNSMVVSPLQYNKMLSFKISRCQDEYSLLK